MSARARDRARGLWPWLLLAAVLTALVVVPWHGQEGPDPPAGGQPGAIERSEAKQEKQFRPSFDKRELPETARRSPAGPSAAQLLPFDREHMHIDFGGERGGKVIIYVDHDIPTIQARAAWRSLLKRTGGNAADYRVIYRPVGARAAGPGQRRPLASAQAFAESLSAFLRGALPAAALTPATDRLRGQLGNRPPERTAGPRPRAGPVQLLSRSADHATARFVVDDGEALATYRVALVLSGGGWAVDRLTVVSVRAGA